MTAAERHALKLLACKHDMERVARDYYGMRYVAGMAPPEKVYRARGRFKPHRIRKLAGGLPWRKAVLAYGLRDAFAAKRLALPPSERRRIIEALHRVAAETKEPDLMPRVRDFERLNGEGLGREDVRQLVDGGNMLRSKRENPHAWERAAEEAGLKPRRKMARSHTRAQMIADYRDCATRRRNFTAYRPGGHGPLRVEFLKTVKYKDRDIRRLFPGGFNELVEASGYLPRSARGGWRSITLRRAA